MTNLTLIADSDCDFAKVTPDDTYLVFVLKMPFRFKVASPGHCRFEYRKATYDIWVNNLPLPAPEAHGFIFAELEKEGRTVDSLWSTVAVIPHKSRMTVEECDKLNQHKQGDKLDALGHSLSGDNFDAMQALNAYIVGYNAATNELYGGTVLQPMTPERWFEALGWQVSIVGIPIDSWNVENIDNLFSLGGHQVIHSGPSIRGPLDDIAVDKINDIANAIRRLDNHYFYELAFEARVKLASGDEIGALLLAVAALEAAHGTFASQMLSAKLPQDRSGEDKGLEDKFLKDLGFSTCNKLTPFLLMDPEDRPSPELVGQVTTAIKYRNEIMHGLRNSKGEYKIRLRTKRELCEAYSAALRMFGHYRQAVERLEPL